MKTTTKYTDVNWDIENPLAGHEKRFIKKLTLNHPKKRTFPFSIAASLAFILGSLLTYAIVSNTKPSLSPETQKTQDYFSSVIETELNTLKSKKNPKTEKQIQDAIIQLDILEKDYQKLKEEIKTQGENKHIIYAMVINMQTRLSFLKTVIEQIDNINQLQIHHNENTI
jgi:hypothetical protein